MNKDEQESPKIIQGADASCSGAIRRQSSGLVCNTPAFTFSKALIAVVGCGKGLSAPDWTKDPHSFQAIMDGYANEQRPEKVGEILKEAQAAGVEPNLETFIILLKTFAFVGDAKGAWETYRALRSAG
jgi:pentatricopeptide repeat protein